MFAEPLLILLGLYVLYKVLVESPAGQHRLPPGPWRLPLVGSVLQLLGRNVPEVLRECGENYGELFYVELGTSRCLFLNSAELVGEVFSNSACDYRLDEMPTIEASGGKHGILAGEGKEWQEQRRFCLRHLKDFGFGKNQMESLILDEVNDLISWIINQESSTVDMAHAFDISVLNALWRITTSEHFAREDAESMDTVKRISAAFLRPSWYSICLGCSPRFSKTFPWLSGLKWARRIASEFRDARMKIIADHEEALPDADCPRDFVDAYLHEIQRTADKTSSFYGKTGFNSLVAVLGDFFLGGSETTSITLEWAIFYIAKHPEVQKKLQAEIDDVVGTSRQVSLSDRPALPYMMATVLEILRKSSVSFIGVPHTSNEDLAIRDYSIPARTWLVPSIYAIHHDKKHWQEPECFRPERFLNCDGKSVVKSEHLLPFSLGRRQCIGEGLAKDTVFLFVSNIIQRFWVCCDPTVPEPGIEPRTSFMLLPPKHSLIFLERLK